MICKNCGIEIPNNSIICPVCKNVAIKTILDIDAEMWDGEGTILIPLLDKKTITFTDDMGQIFIIGVKKSTAKNILIDLIVWNNLLKIEENGIVWASIDKDILKIRPDFVYVGSPVSISVKDEATWILK